MVRLAEAGEGGGHDAGARSLGASPVSAVSCCCDEDGPGCWCWCELLSTLKLKLSAIVCCAAHNY